MGVLVDSVLISYLLYNEAVTFINIYEDKSLSVTFLAASSTLILGDPGADSGDEEKSKRSEKCGTKKSKERREEPLGTMSYQTSSKRSPSFWLLIGAT